ncbi:UNVERIFIED_CONTAM: VOC family protein [Microbacterium sp. SLM126]|uniref:VOC family protein n=1 Tax=Microbacterium sp. Root180 TaxID=1736483 RepID=UPI0006FFAB67|nr:VOC family protein [Microbacterium sp. Root180]KRB36853.1 glyoxalase [Microbacterium sp. Root180]
MFTPDRAFSGFAVKDLGEAKAFYGDTLGIPVQELDMGLLELTLGSGAKVMVYPKPDHVPAVFTIMNFDVDDVEAAVDDLNDRGIATKIYDDADFPTDAKGISRDMGPAIAWFLDPSGNVLAVVEAS